MMLFSVALNIESNTKYQNCCLRQRKMRSSEWKRGDSKAWIDNPQPSGPRNTSCESKIFILPRQQYRVLMGYTFHCACVKEVRKILYRSTFLLIFITSFAFPIFQNIQSDSVKIQTPGAKRKTGPLWTTVSQLNGSLCF